MLNVGLHLNFRTGAAYFGFHKRVPKSESCKAFRLNCDEILTFLRQNSEVWKMQFPLLSSVPSNICQCYQCF